MPWGWAPCTSSLFILVTISSSRLWEVVCSLVLSRGRGVHFPSCSCRVRPWGSAASAVTQVSVSWSPCLLPSTELSSCLNPAKSSVTAPSGIGPLLSSAVNPPVGVPWKFFPGVGGRAGDTQMGTLMSPLTGDGELIDAGSLSWRDAPSASPRGGNMRPRGLVGLEE